MIVKKLHRPISGSFRNIYIYMLMGIFHIQMYNPIVFEQTHIIKWSPSKKRTAIGS